MLVVKSKSLVMDMNDSNPSVSLFSDSRAVLSQVGGKGFSLMRMAQGGFPVPPGMVLHVDFFNEWLDILAGHDELRMTETDSDDVLESKTLALKKVAAELTFSRKQRLELDAVMAELPVSDGQLFSVRSSSPDEDMEGASFAGMYETYLGVTHEKIEARVRDVFISCLDYRVVAYKRRKGFDFTRYAIAVVVMQQIRSEVAGVAFSINPLNNCYDEIVINANFGLGESVVSGVAVPDEYVVDKVDMQILSCSSGKKGVRIDIGDDGGTMESSGDESDSPALNDGQILELSRMVRKVEGYYGMPMDTEWAYADQQFFMLQARPITTYVPLHPDFQTEPGAARKLYLDLTLIEQGIERPLSVMGADCFRILSNEMGISATGMPVAEKPGDFIYAAGGRAYVNLTQEMLLEGQEGTAKEYEGLDSYAASIIRNADLSRYRGKATLKGGFKVAKALLTGLFKSGDTISGIIQGSRDPEKLRIRIDERGAHLREALDALDSADLSFDAFVGRSMAMVADFIVHTSIPSLVVAESAKSGLKKLIAREVRDKDLLEASDQIDRGLPHNVTMEMNCLIYELTALLSAEELDHGDALLERILSRNMPGPFLEKWDGFMKRFGFRGPREVDVKTPRYQDAPLMVIKQMQGYASLAEESSPAAVIRRQAIAREEIYQKVRAGLHHHAGKLDKLYQELTTLGGYREIHKYYLVYAGEKIRYRVIRAAEALIDAGRMDCVEDAFSLKSAELQQALDDREMDVRAMVMKHREYMDIAEQIDHFPPVIDSRGTILRPPRTEPADGELAGIPVSAGKVSGRVVVVDHVGEKPVEKGAILVAKAADPGWTPLFINAAGIILEVGGMLQHGSLIAREYGKPCITGIENLTTLLKDGDTVEMDGATGIVRVS